MTERRGPDLLFQDEIRDAVRAAYGAIPTGAGRAAAERFYPAAELAEVPEEAISWALGVGNPIADADLVPGEVVLDLGCGAGIDTVLAARRVGPSGRAVGLDTLPEMCARAEAAAVAAGTDTWCEFHVGEMEDIPLPDASVDVVISNGVLNLSPRKSRALAETARVLRPGGRVCLVDLTVEDDLPPEVLASPAAWAGCIAGAISERVLIRKLDRAGFEAVDTAQRGWFSVDDVALYPLFTPEVVELMRRRLPTAAQARVAMGIVARAHKPREGASVAPSTSSSVSRVRSIEDVPVEATSEAPGVAIRPLEALDDASLKILDVAPGGSTPFHRHAHAHVGVVLAGAGHLRLGEQHRPIEPGDVFTIGATDEHAIEAGSDRPLRFVCLDCLTP